MKYHCSGCDYIYDEIKWDEDLEINPHTFFDDLPIDFFCPFCDTHKDDFVVFEENINYPISQNRLTFLEQIHSVDYEIIQDELKYNISSDVHPNIEEHYIYKITLHDDSGDMIEEKKFNFWDKINWVFDLSYLDSFEIRVYCSLEWIFSTWIIER